MSTKENNAFGKRLHALMLDKGYVFNGKPHQSGLARDTGLSQAQINRYLKGINSPNMAVIESIANALRVPVSVLAGEVPLEGAKPIFRVGVVCPIVNIEEVTKKMEITNLKPQGYIQCPIESTGNVFAVEITNGAMSPKLNPGDIVFIDEKAKPKSGDIVLAFGKGSSVAVIRQLVKDGNKTMIIAENPNWFDPVIETTMKDIRGKVIFSGKSL
jgi:SOS-response transcriptional repressor LexA